MSTQVFPSLPGLTYSVNREMDWSTNVQENISGKEVRIGYWAYPRFTWEMSFSFLRSSTSFNEFQNLWGFICARQGRLDSFLYADVEDFSVTNQSLGSGDSTDTTFQLLTQFGGSSAIIMPVLAPNAVSRVTVAGTSVSSTSFTVGAWQSTAPGPGVIQFSTFAPSLGQAVAASFTYYYPCRFDEDVTTFENFMQKLWKQDKLTFKSIK